MRKKVSYLNPSTDAGFNSKNGKYIYIALQALKAAETPSRVFFS